LNKLIKVILSTVMVLSYVASTGVLSPRFAYAYDEEVQYIEADEMGVADEVWMGETDHFYEVLAEVDERFEPYGEDPENIATFDEIVVDTREVSTWDELRAAMSDASVDHITLTRSITRTGAATNHLPSVSRHLTIDGNGYTLSFAGNTAHAFRLARRSAPTRFIIQNLRVQSIGTDYFIMHNDTTAVATASGHYTGNWIVQLHDVEHVETRTAAAMIKVPNSQLILTGNIRWNTTNARVSTAAASTAGMIVVRGLTITDGATVNLRAVHTVINIAPSVRVSTWVTIAGGSVVDLYSQNRQAIWMNRDLAGTSAANNPVSFVVVGEGTVLNARSDGSGSGQANGVISIAGAGPRPSGDFGGYSTAVRIAEGARVLVDATGPGRNMPAFIVQVYRGVMSVRDEGTRVELRSNGGDNVSGATLLFRRVGNQALHVNEAQLIVTRRGSVSRAAAVRFEGSYNAINTMSAANVRIHNSGDGTRRNRENQGVEFTSSGAMYFWGGDLGTLTPTTVNITATTGPGVTNAGSFESLGMMARDLASVNIEGNTSSATSGAIDGRILGIVMDSVTNFNVVNRRPGGGQAFNTDDFSGLTVLNSTVRLWRVGATIHDGAAQTWPRVDFLMTGPNFRTVEMTSYPRLTQGAIGARGMGQFSRFHATVQGVRLDNSALVNQINRITLEQALGGPIGNPYRNNFTDDSWEEMIRVRLIVDSIAVRHNPYLSRLALSHAVTQMREATDNLVDLRPLRAEIAMSVPIRDAGIPEDVSQVRWNTFNARLTEAQEVVANPAATRAQVNTATARLQAARMQLTPLSPGDVVEIGGFNWIVLRVDENDNALVTTQRIVGSASGGRTSTLAYDGSPLDRAMINFYNRLPEEARAMIVPVILPNDERITFNSANTFPSSFAGGGFSYVDYEGQRRVFALSANEVRTFTSVNARAVRPLPNVGFGANPGAQVWWTRSRGGTSTTSTSIEANGTMMSNRARTATHGLRPAMWIGEQPTPPATLDRILEQLARIDLLDEADYTAASWEAMLAVRTSVQAAIAENDLEQETIYELTDMLRGAINNLISVRGLVDEIQANQAIEALGQRHYLTVKWQELLASIEAAQALVNRGDATEREINDAITRLTDARDLAVAVGDLIEIDGFTWRVLTFDEDHHAMVVANRLVGLSRSGATSTRAYLGSPLDHAMINFYNTLSPETRAMIQTANLPEETVIYTNALVGDWPNAVEGGLSYVDEAGVRKVFALSYSELNAYLGFVPTGQGTINNGDVRANAFPNVGFGENPGNMFFGYWLRSPGSRPTHASSVSDLGAVGSTLETILPDRGVRPAMWIR